MVIDYQFGNFAQINANFHMIIDNYLRYTHKNEIDDYYLGS